MTRASIVTPAIAFIALLCAASAGVEDFYAGKQLSFIAGAGPGVGYDLQARMAVNYGLNRVRFPAPVRVGSCVRATSIVREAQEVAGGIQVVTGTTIEIEGGDKPACVVEAVARYFR